MNFTVKQFLELVGYRTNDNSEYYDDALGNPLYCISYWNEKHDQGGYSFSCIYNLHTLDVVQLEAHDFGRRRSYRWNPAHLADSQRSPEAYDDVTFTQLEVIEDYVEKVDAMLSGVDYDARIVVPVNLSDEEFLLIAKAAHQQDVTFNEFVERAVKSALESHSKK